MAHERCPHVSRTTACSSSHRTPNGTPTVPRATQKQSPCLLGERLRLQKNLLEKEQEGLQQQDSSSIRLETRWSQCPAPVTLGCFTGKCWTTAVLIDATAPGEVRAKPVKAVTSISLSASGGGWGMEGFYLLCVINNVKVLETLDKQLGSILRLESNSQINKLISSTEVF